MTDYVQEQEMEIEALEAILMDEFKELHPGESGLNTSKPCYQITIDPQDDEPEDSSSMPVQLALIFAHTENYPDEPPLLNVRSLRGISPEDLRSLKEQLEEESDDGIRDKIFILGQPLRAQHLYTFNPPTLPWAGDAGAADNLGMAMIYTLVSSAQEWLNGRFRQDGVTESAADDDLEKDEVIVPHGDPVTVETFLAWRERYEAEIALERAKLMPDSALATTKEKRLTGRQWFESGKAVAAARGALTSKDESEGEDEEDIDFDDDDFEDDEDDMLEHYLAEKSED